MPIEIRCAITAAAAAAALMPIMKQAKKVKNGIHKEKTSKMAKITLVERNCVMEWCHKERKDKKMNHARWIRNGGAKDSSMTATSGEVRTSGAYEALGR